MIQRIIYQLYQAISFRLPAFNKKISQPLLSHAEILDLLHRVQNKNKSVSHKHEIAHRQSGNIRSIYRGYGMDYEESRRYQPGDDPRYMNWQLSARTGHHYMKVFREERQPGVFILIDRRASMRFGTRTRLKITQAARVAAFVAFTAQENNLPVGGLILDDELKWFNENQKKQAIFDFIFQLVKAVSPAFILQKKTEISLNNVLPLLNEILISGSKIYLISDFHDINESSQAALLQMTASHQVFAIQITDPAEVKIPHAGAVNLLSSDLETIIPVNTNNTNEREKYESDADNYFSNIKGVFKNTAINYQEILSSNNPIEKQIIF